MNLPNVLTISRLFIIAGMMAALQLSIPYAYSLALLLFVVGGFTDYLDGYLARSRNQITAFGKLMDPLADKVMVCAAFISFVEIHMNVAGKRVALMPAWIVVVIVSREFLVTGLRLLAAEKRNIVPAGRWGKHKTVWQIVAISAILLGLAIRNDVMAGAEAKLLSNFDFAFYWVSHVMGMAVALVTVASGFMYFSQHRELISMGRG